MARQLYFMGQRVGDNIVKIVPDNSAQTPPSRHTGLFQQFTSVNADSINIQRCIRVSIDMSKDNEVRFAREVDKIQRLTGQRGDVEIRDGGLSTPLRMNDWLLDQAGPPNVPGGFGGRFTGEWELVFIGDSPAEWF
jgi:hypothetical protein